MEDRVEDQFTRLIVSCKVKARTEQTPEVIPRNRTPRAGLIPIMNNPRSLLFALLAAVLVAWGAWHIYSGWGLVTIKVDKAPVGTVLASIGKQGGIEIVSNLDPSTPVSLDVYRVPPLEALDIVTVRTDSSWRLAYLGAPDRGQIDTVLGAFRVSGDTSGWTSHGRGGGFSFVEREDGQPLDLRKAQWLAAETGELHTLLEDAADKTGAFLAAPSDWTPRVTPPAAGPLTKAAPRLFENAGGTGREVFLVRGPGPEGGRETAEGGGWRGGGWIGSRERSGTGGGGPGARTDGGPGRGMGNPGTMMARAEVQIALLPATEQAKAREELAAMQKTWEEVRALPEDQRREKMREIMNRPEVAERMEQRRLAREAKMTPEQRINRTKQYWERKAEAKAGGGGGQ
jgi:hypothetical protein